MNATKCPATRANTSSRSRQALPSAPFFRSLAGVFLTAGSGSALKANALSPSASRQAHPRQWLWRWGCFAICLSYDFVAHGEFLIQLKINPRI
jgi:hypothetical protein